MVRGEFTKEEAEETKKAVEEVMNRAIPKSRVVGYIGHFNDIFLFLDSCIRHFNDEKHI